MYGQCALNVHLHQFQNMYNAEIRPKNGVDRVCCCDQDSCTYQTSLTKFSTTTKCSSSKFCDTFFQVSLIDSQVFAPYSAYSFSDVFFGNSTMTDVNYDFQFVLCDVPSEPVRMHTRIQSEFVFILD